MSTLGSNNLIYFAFTFSYENFYQQRWVEVNLVKSIKMRYVHWGECKNLCNK